MNEEGLDGGVAKVWFHPTRLSQVREETTVQATWLTDAPDTILTVRAVMEKWVSNGTLCSCYPARMIHAHTSLPSTISSPASTN